ncbi:MAG: hypothetical protein M3R36_17695 [Bacteroidota bacterium]|nr:hypothetical protein [Bacteroidota bacterium]
MSSLNQDLQQRIISLNEFGKLTIRILDYLPNILSAYLKKGDYRIYSSKIAEATKYLRPINEKFFIFNSTEFKADFVKFLEILKYIKENRDYLGNEKEIIDKVTYTIQQSIGVGLDLLVNPNSARKHVGNRFEELIRLIFVEMGISNKRLVLQIPYESDEGGKIYKCENDIILSPFSEVRATPTSIDSREVIVSLKTTSKDRMSKVFIDKLLIERFLGQKQKFILILLNDVQRKKDNNISYTLVSGLFMVYTKFLSQLEGIYYLDPPPNAKKAPYNSYMKTFSDLICKDIFRILAP